MCSKGIFFIETKHWKIDTTKDFERKLLEQIEKIKRTISFIFKDKINLEVIKILLVGTEKKINLENNSNSISLRMDELKDFLLNQKDVLTKDEINLVLNEFSQYLPKEKFPEYPRNTLVLKKLWIKGMNFIKRTKPNHVNV